MPVQRKRETKAKRNYIIVFYLLRRTTVNEQGIGGRHHTFHTIVVLLPFALTIVIGWLGVLKWNGKYILTLNANYVRILSFLLSIRWLKNAYVCVEYSEYKFRNESIYFGNKSFKLNFEHPMHIKSANISGKLTWGRNSMFHIFYANYDSSLHLLCSAFCSLTSHRWI